MDLQKLNMDKLMNDKDSLAAKPSGYEMALQNDLTEEKNPVKQNTIITKELYRSTLGGSVQFVDKTGGTVILTYDPATGTVTLNGGVIIGQTVTVGTLNSALYTNGTIQTTIFTGGTINSAVLGTPAVTGGTLTNPTINTATVGTPIVTGGTVNPVLYKINGTSGVDGTFVYVGSINWAGSTNSLGTIKVDKGIVTSIV